MITVELKDLRFFAHHGISEEERLTGNEYIVNLEVMYDPGDSDFDNLDDVVNYETVFEIVRKRMMVPTPLLEKVANSIIRKIHHKLSSVQEIRISIHKVQAPIPYLDGMVGVKMVRQIYKEDKEEKKKKKK